jgi:transcriptional regulator with XRE-family HTH domain
MKEREVEGFGQRLSQIRRSRGMTQGELGDSAGVSNRVIAYYEADGAQPPGAMLVDLARALRVSTDQLLGLKPAKEKTSPRTARLLKRLQKIEALPPADQRTVLKILDSLLTTHGRRNGHR